MCKTVLTSYKTRLFSVHNALWKTCGKPYPPADNYYQLQFSTSIHSLDLTAHADKWKNTIQISENKQLISISNYYIVWKI